MYVLVSGQDTNLVASFRPKPEQVPVTTNNEIRGIYQEGQALPVAVLGKCGDH
jgi:hypothetical protein